MTVIYQAGGIGKKFTTVVNIIAIIDSSSNLHL